MSEEEPERSRRARAAAELALTRVAYHYGAKPGSVLLGGLVPELLCSDSTWLHAGTTDVDVQVNLEIAADAANAVRLEHALKAAHLQPSDDKVWRWIQVDADGRKTIVKFELLADLDTERAETVINFDDPDAPGPNAYVTQFRIDHPEADLEEAAADAVLAVTGFCDIVADV